MVQPVEWDVVVVGGAKFDYLVRGPQLPAPGDTVQGKMFQAAAALAVALAEGRSLIEAGSWANAAAALKTTRLGAQAGLPRREEVVALLAQIQAGKQPLGAERRSKK